MIKKTAPKTHKVKKVVGRLPSINPHFTLNVDVEVVVEIQDGVVRDVELFNTEAEALEHLSGVIGKKFRTIDAFRDWQDEHFGHTEENYFWFQKSIELGL